MRIIMHDTERRGFLQESGKPMDPDFIAKKCAISRGEYDTTLLELVSVHIPASTSTGIIYDPIMAEQEQTRKIRTKSGHMGGNPDLCENYNIPGYVYLMKRENGDVKIGISVCPEKRAYRVRQTLRDASVLVIAKRWVENMGEQEGELHKKYAKYQTFGEWFTFPLDEETRLINGYFLLKVNDKVKGKVNLKYEIEDESIIPDDLKVSTKEIMDWINYKRERKEKYKPSGLTALWNVLRAIPQDRHRAAVDHSIVGGYQGLFEPKGGQSNGSKPTGGAKADSSKYAD